MKKKHLFAVALAPLVASAAAPPLGALEVVDGPVDGPSELRPVSVNRLSNPGFEDSTVLPWQALNHADAAFLDLQSTDVRNGEQSLIAGSLAAEASFVQFNVPLGSATPGATYSLGVWAKIGDDEGPGGDGPIGDPIGGRLILDDAPVPLHPLLRMSTWVDGELAPRTDLGTVDRAITDEWTFVTTSFTLPEAGYDDAYVEFYLMNSFTTYVFDDAVFIEGSFTTPEAPTGVTAEAGIDSLEVSWDAAHVGWDGGEGAGHEVSQYHVTVMPTITKDALVVDELPTPDCVTTETSCVLDGLEPGVDYTVAVRAFNVMGPGAQAHLFTSTLDATEPTPGEQEGEGDEVDELAPLRVVQGERAAAGRSMDPAHGIVARLYWAVLGRAPEAGGARFWFDLYDEGEWDLRRIARHFAESPEFNERFGADLDDEGFALLVYTNALGRTPDADGLAWWLEQLADGMSRAEMVLLISDSPEFRSSHPMPWD